MKSDIQKHIEQAIRIVSKWPKWKRDILVNSGNPKVKVPRKPL